MKNTFRRPIRTRNKLMLWAVVLTAVVLIAAALSAVYFKKAPLSGRPAKAVPEALSAEARAEIDAGIAAAGQKDYMLAMSHFEKARRYSPNAPEVLFNLALANDKVGGRELVAVPWYYAYLESSPAAENRQKVLARITELKAAFESRVRKLLNWDRELVSQMDCEDLEVNAATSHGESMIMHYEAGDFAGIAATAAKISNEYWRSEMYRNLVLKQLESGDIEGALGTLSSMNRSDDFTVEAYCKTAEALLGAGRREEALGLIKKAEALAAGVKKSLIDHSLSSYISIARACAAYGDKDTAGKYLAMHMQLTRDAEFHDMGFGIDARSQRIYAYANLALEAEKLGFPDEAKKAFGLAKEESLKYKEYVRALSCLCHIASNQKEAGYAAEGLKTIEEARAGMQWITAADLEKYNTSINGRYDLSAEDQKWEEEFKDRNFMAGYLVRAYAGMGDLKKAQEALDTIAMFREGPAAELAKAAARKGEIEYAMRLAGQIGAYYGYDKASVYAEIAKKQAELGDQASAESAARLTIKEHEKDQSYQMFHDEAYKAIVSARLKKGDFAGARNAAASIISLKARYFTYCDIAKAQTAKGGSKKAIALWQETALRNGTVGFLTDLSSFLKSLSAGQEKAEDTVTKVMDTVRAMTAALREIEIIRKIGKIGDGPESATP